ncbi:MAG: hypothetical protein ACYC2H_05830 [Thermoplasmatota archaeon]
MRRFHVAAVLLAVAALGLPGCLEDGVSLLTAQEARGQADRVAEAWEPDAMLVNAYGVEAGPQAREQMAAALRQGREPGSEAEIPDEEGTLLAAVSGADEDVPGDGKAPVWVFEYVSDDAEASFQVTVTSAGVAFEQESEEAEVALFGNLPIGDWRIDSDEGARVAHEDEAYDAAVEDPEAFVVTVLVQVEDKPIWLFAAGGPGSEEEFGAFVAVDASTGDAIDAQAIMRQLVGFVIREAGSFDGTLTAPDTSFGGSFDIELEGHGLLVVLVAVSPPPLVPMQVTVTDPAGTEYTETLDRAVGVDATRSLAINAVLAGEYTVEVSADAAVLNDWELSWCTDGQAIVPQGSRACDLVGTANRDARASQAETLSWPGHWPWA